MVEIVEMDFPTNILYSSDKVSLSYLIGQIFDIEGTYLKDGILLKTNSFKFLVKDRLKKSPKTLYRSEGPLYLFKLSNKPQLDDLFNKLKFIFYRNTSFNKKDSLSAVKEEKDEYFFLLSDVDGRKWKFYSEREKGDVDD